MATVNRQERVRASLLKHLPPRRPLRASTILGRMGKSVRLVEFEAAIDWAVSEGIATLEDDRLCRIQADGKDYKPISKTTVLKPGATLENPTLKWLDGIHAGVIITPRLAAEMLNWSETVFVNRNLSEMHVEKIAQAIKAGKFVDQGDVIRISKEGAVVDGQHRLWAVVQADKSVRTNVLCGFNPDLMEYVDCDRRLRSVGDFLRQNGYANVMVLQSTISTVWRYKSAQFRKGSKGRPNMYTSMNFFKRDKTRFVDATTFCGRFADLKGCPRNGVALLYYMISQESMLEHRPANLDMLDKFMVSLRNPVGITKDDARLAFMRRMKFQGNPTRKVDNVHMIALLIKAWNYCLLNRPTTSLTWKRLGGPGHTREAFPEVLVPGKDD